MPGHHERKHSKFSASGAERWFNCPGSVELSEGQPDVSSSYAQEGTKAHEVLETIVVDAVANKQRLIGKLASEWKWRDKFDKTMIAHAVDATNFMLRLRNDSPGSEILIETRVYLDFIHPEMFGTYDGAIVDYFGTLHICDYKYGAGHAVSPTKNLQAIFYGIGVAHKLHWNFKRVRLWIIQPRIKGYDGPIFWEIPTAELKRYVDLFKSAVDRVLREPNVYKEGSWCHWCKAIKVCPLKNQTRLAKAKEIFSQKGVKENGKQKENVETKKGKDKKEESRQEEKSESQNRRIFKTQEDWNVENEIEALAFQEREDAGDYDEFY